MGLAQDKYMNKYNLGIIIPQKLDLQMGGNAFKREYRNFPGGSVVENPSASAGDTSLIPGPGRSHMPRSN